jgi:hypothetical protein
MKRFLKIVERLAGYAILLAMIVAVVMIVGQPQTTGGNQDAFSGSTDQKKKLAIFLDGTWNQVNSNTNVWRMRALCAPKDTAGTQQLIYYEVGVNGFLGGVFGKASTITFDWPTNGSSRTTTTATKSSSLVSVAAHTRREVSPG